MTDAPKAPHLRIVSSIEAAEVLAGADAGADFNDMLRGAS